MKKSTKLLILALLFVLPAQAQFAQSINFDNYTSATNNDLVNNFVGAYTFVQQQAGGITGGAVALNMGVPSQAASYIKAIKFSSTKTSVSICFKFSNAAFQDNGTDAAILSFQASATTFLSIKATGHTLKTGTNSSSNSISIASGGKLVDGHWYQLKAEVAEKTSGFLDVSTWLYDLGASGTATPLQILYRIDDRYLNEFAAHNNVATLLLNGNYGGGGVLLDDFSINGKTVGIEPARFSSKFSICPIQGIDAFLLQSTLNSAAYYELLSSGGAVLSNGTIKNCTIIPTGSLASGQYFVRIYNQANSVTMRVVKL